MSADIHQVNMEMSNARESVGQDLSTDDLSMAENAIIQFCQKKRFNSEIYALTSGNPVKRSSTIYRLNPSLKDGLLRVGGRLSHTAMPEQSKHPVILSKDQHIAMLILKHIHEKNRTQWEKLHHFKLSKKYQMTHANAAAKKILASCIFRKRHKGKLCNQKMADRPKERITSDVSHFTSVGVNYFGPIEVKQGRSYVKRYGVIFTCMASRAVHLEVAHSLDTDSCISVIRRFMCRRGPVSHFQSDNGTNFTGAEKELKRAVAEQ